MKKAIIALILALSLSTLPLLLARANPGDSPFDNLWVWPVGGTETGDPIATLSPADMFIRTKSEEHPAYDVWILLAVNEETYNKLDRIEITNGISVTYPKDEFHDGLIEPNARIPALEPYPEGEPYQDGYPGCEFDDQYSIGAIKDKLGTTGPVYYCIKYVFGYVDTTEIFFTITVYAPGITAEELKVLVLANGACYQGKILDQCTAYSKAALIVIPELATILLATASLTAFGVYTLKHRKK